MRIFLDEDKRKTSKCRKPVHNKILRRWGGKTLAVIAFAVLLQNAATGSVIPAVNCHSVPVLKSNSAQILKPRPHNKRIPLTLSSPVRAVQDDNETSSG